MEKPTKYGKFLSPDEIQAVLNDGGYTLSSEMKLRKELEISLRKLFTIARDHKKVRIAR
jgi:hypothetical protein